MFFSKKPSRPQNRIDTLIGAETRVQGDVSFSGGLRVDGTIFGNVSSRGDGPSTLVLSENARIEGRIQVSHVVINGTVVGPVHASEYVELQPKARVSGDVFYKTLEMHLGAIVEGKLVHEEGTPAQAGLGAPGAIDQSA
ncbi:MAG: polymer-forming cytoskeletal protein [Burkholderiales bacterium]